MKPADPDQYEAATRGRLPDVESVREGLWSLPFEIPFGHVTYSLGYVIDDFSGGLHIVDPGWPTEQNWARLTDFLASTGKSVSDIATVTSTHLHPDHLGLGGMIRGFSGAVMVVHRIEDEAAQRMCGSSSLSTASEHFVDWGVPPDRWAELCEQGDRPPLPKHTGADVLLDDGDTLPIPGRHIEAILTPGHTSGHLCFHDKDTDVLFSGDHVMPRLRAGLGLGASSPNPVGDYLIALRRVAGLDYCEIAPGHEYRFHGLADRCLSTAAHHVRRGREVRAEMEADPTAGVWEIASRLPWHVGWSNMTGDYAVSALAQTQMQMDFVRSDLADDFLSDPEELV